MDVRAVLKWMGSDGSPYGREHVKAFNDLTSAGNLGWFDTVKDDYDKALAGGYQPQAPGRYTGGERLRAHPAPVTESLGFKDTADFQDQLLAVDNDVKLSKAQRTAKRNELIQRRAKQRGETVRT